MDISAVITRVATATGIAQVVEATPSGYQAPIDSSAQLYSELNSIVGGRMYPLFQGDNPTYPTITYDLIDSQPGIISGYRVTQADTFHVKYRTTTYPDLITGIGSIVAALDGATDYNMEVNSLSLEYEDDKKIYVAHMQVEMAYLPLVDQTLPAVMVYPISRDADESTFDNFIKQRVNNQYALIVITSSNNLSTLLDNIQSVLLGFEQEVGYNDMEYVSGSSIEGVSGLEIWREIYEDSNYIEEQP